MDFKKQTKRREQKLSREKALKSKCWVTVKRWKPILLEINSSQKNCVS